MSNTQSVDELIAIVRNLLNVGFTRSMLYGMNDSQLKLKIEVCGWDENSSWSIQSIRMALMEALKNRGR